MDAIPSLKEAQTRLGSVPTSERDVAFHVRHYSDLDVVAADALCASYPPELKRLVGTLDKSLDTYWARRNKPIDGDDWEGPSLLGVRRVRVDALIQTSLRLWGRDARMLSMFQAEFAVIHFLGSPGKSFCDESQSDGSAVTESAFTKNIWWHVSLMLFRPHYPSFQEMVVTSFVARACVSERRQTATGGKRIVEPCMTQAYCSCHLSPQTFFKDVTFCCGPLQPQSETKASAQCLGNNDAFATLNVEADYDWRMKLHRLSDWKTPVDAADFKLVNQHARPHGSAEYQFWLPTGHRRTPRGEGGRHWAGRGARRGRGGRVGRVLPRREHSFFGDDVDESADRSELDVSDQGPVEPVQGVVLEDLQAEIDFVETASRHELLGGLNSTTWTTTMVSLPVALSGATAPTTTSTPTTRQRLRMTKCSCSTTESSRRVQILATHSKKKGPKQHSQVRLPISITAAPHQSLQLGVQAIHRRRHSCTAGFLRGKAAHVLWLPGEKMSLYHDFRLTAEWSNRAHGKCVLTRTMRPPIRRSN